MLPEVKFQTCVNFTKSKTCYLLLFCHGCLNLLLSELDVAQCSSFVKLHEWIPAMYFVSMFQCCSIFILMHLDGYLLFIADRCHICFAFHFQTVHPIPVIFISISTEINSPFQWHSWISKLRPGSIIPFQVLHMHRIPHLAYPAMFMCWLFTMLCASFRCLPIRVGSGNITFVRTRSTTPVCLLHGLVLLPCGISGKIPYPRNHFYLCLLDACSFAMPMLRYLPLAYHSTHIVEPSL